MRFRPLAIAMAALIPMIRSEAQVTAKDSMPPDSLPPREPARRCNGERISNIVVITQPPYTERLPRNFELLRSTVRKLHVNTRDNVVLRYLLLELGQPCIETARAESERILRAQPFLVDAQITPFPDGHGGVRIEVETRDEFSLVVSPRIGFGDQVFRGLRVGERNLVGAAIDASLVWKHSTAYDDLIGFRFAAYQFAATRSELRVIGTRDEFGNEYLTELVRPYYTDLQRLAWRASVGGTKDHAMFLRPELEPNALVVHRNYLSVGGIARVGPSRRLRLVGLSLTHEEHRTNDNPVLLTNQGAVPDTSGPVPGAFRSQDVTRLNALLGMRRFRYQRVQGFDALTGAQDVRVGVQVGLLAGQSIRIFGSDADRFLSSDIFAGYGSQKSYVGMQMVAEGRRDLQANQWDGMLTSGRLAWYLRPAVHQLTLVESEWAAGSTVRVPFQLAFNDPEGGLLGYHKTRVPGGQRLVVRTEQRMVFPNIRGIGDGGIALFADAGRLWKGNVPYGVTTTWRGSAGISILAAVPPRSRRLWRLDVGFPIGNDPDARIEFRFSSADRSRTFWREPRDLRGARERTTPTSLFSWP